MAQLTVDAGVTLRSPVEAAGGDSTRSLGWEGGEANTSQQRGSVDLAIEFLYGGYSDSIQATRALSPGVVLPRFADNVRLSPFTVAGENLLTAAEASGEAAPGTLWEFVLGAGTVTQSSNYETEGVASVRIETTANVGGRAKALLRRVIPVKPGHTYSAGWDITVPTLFGAGNTYTFVRWLDADGLSLGESTFYWPPASAPEFARAAGTVVAPRRAVGARLGLWSEPVGGSAGYIYHLDKGLLREGSSTTYVAPTAPATLEMGYAGYDALHIAPTRTAYRAEQAAGQRTSTGIVARDPVDEYIVTTPPVLRDLGGSNNRIQRFQRNGVQAVFFKDQGHKSTWTRTARAGFNTFVENGRSDSTWTRTGLAGLDLADLVALGQGPAPRVRTGVASADLLVVHDEGILVGDRSSTGTNGVSLLTLLDLGGFGGRSGTSSPVGVVARPYDDHWTQEVPYAYEGGTITMALMQAIAGVLSDTVFEAGYHIVPPGTDLTQNVNPNGKWVYVGWWDEDVREAVTSGYNLDGTTGGPYYWGVDTAEGVRRYHSGGYMPPFEVAGGDLYTYAFGNQFDSSDPAETKPTVLPSPPPPLVQQTTIPAGPHPLSYAGAETRFPPANDRLRSHVTLSGASGSVVFTDVAATLEATEPPLSFGTFGFRGSVWFRWEPNYDGQVTLSAPGAGLEAYKGPAPEPLPVVGVNGYRGDWGSGVTYAAGDTVVYNGKRYTTSATVTDRSPDAPDVLGPDIKGVKAVTQADRDIPLGQRVTLQPGDYYWIGDGDGQGYINPGNIQIAGPVTISEQGSYNTDGAGSWGNNFYQFPFALYDSVTGVEVVRVGPFSSFGFGSGYRQSQRFTLTQAITFDTLRIDATNYSPSSADFYGIATSIGSSPSGIVWARGTSDINPWGLTPDTDPLTFENLMPVGGGLESLTTDTRLGDRFYIRAYPLTEAAQRTLTWQTHVALLDVTIPVAELPSAPAMMNVVVGNMTPNALVQFRIDGSSTVVGTAVADDDGFAHTAVAVPALGEGAHLLLATEPGSTRTGNAAFAVGESFDAPPDPDVPPAPPVVVPVPLPVPRWFIQDPTDQTNFVFPINPTRADSTLIPRQLTPSHTTAVRGQPIIFEGGKRAKRYGLQGSLFTLEEVNALKAMKKPYRLYLVDDLGQKMIIKIVGVQTTPVRDTARPEAHSYEVTCLLYGKVPS